MTTAPSFAEDVLKGLSAAPKSLPCKYFYDEKGSRLFQAIMELEEYYLTRSEFEILHMNHGKLLELFGADGRPFNLIEFGAGDGQKIKGLLRDFLNRNLEFTYIPIDISSHALSDLSRTLARSMPGLQVSGLCRDYFHAFGDLKGSPRRNVALFLGSNIGNLTDAETADFLGQVRASLNPGDLLVIGFDLKKDPETVLKAYNDRWGVTRSFNLNLLERINRELQADFNLTRFCHYATYNPLTGIADSYLMSTRSQTVRIGLLDRGFDFKPWEPIHTEISRKYDIPGIEALAANAGFTVVTHFHDCKRYFADSVWRID